MIHGLILRLRGNPLLSQWVVSRAWRKAVRVARGLDWSAEFVRACMTAFRPSRG